MNTTYFQAVGYASAARERIPNTSHDVRFTRDKRLKTALNTSRKTTMQTSNRATLKPIHERIFDPPLRAPAPAGQP